MTSSNALINNPYQAKARAHANIAVAKYWGKRDELENLPLFDSVAFNIDSLFTDTLAVWHDDIQDDELSIDGKKLPAHRLERVKRILNKIRVMKGWTKKCALISHNSFAHSTGLASSASGMAAAALAASAAAHLSLTSNNLSAIARLGSGSAARSIPNGWTRWFAGSRPDGADSYATSIAPHDYWPLNVFAVQVSKKEKKISSSRAMNAAPQSPFWDAFLKCSASAADETQNAIAKKDFNALKSAMHKNMLNLHALNMTLTPPILFFQPQTLQIVQHILKLSQAIPVCCTVDAGANPVILCENVACPFVKNDLLAMNLNFIQGHIAKGAYLLPNNPSQIP